MPNHPNRGRAPSAAANPAPDAIRARREALRLTVRDAAALVYATPTKWQAWEYGTARMHPGLWELFRLKTGAELQLDDDRPP